MANIDSVFDRMFTDPKTPNNQVNESCLNLNTYLFFVHYIIKFVWLYFKHFNTQTIQLNNKIYRLQITKK